MVAAALGMRPELRFVTIDRHQANPTGLDFCSLDINAEISAFIRRALEQLSRAPTLSCCEGRAAVTYSAARLGCPAARFSVPCSSLT